MRIHLANLGFIVTVIIVIAIIANRAVTLWAELGPSIP